MREEYEKKKHLSIYIRKIRISNINKHQNIKIGKKK